MPKEKTAPPEVYPFLAETVRVGSIVAVRYDADATREEFPQNVGKYELGEYYGPVTSIEGDHVKVMLQYSNGRKEEIEYDVTFGYDLHYACCIKRIGGATPKQPTPIKKEGELPPFDDEEDVEYT